MMVKQSLHVDGVEITLRRFKDDDYINLTDMVRNLENGSKIIENWFRSKNTLEFLGVWEQLYNQDFNSLEFEGIMRDAGVNRFFISAKQWIEKTQAIGVIAKTGRYGGTYAHPDIAFEFGAAISPEFKLLLIREFRRLKAEESSRQQLEWSYQRFLTKVNYRLHTDSIKDHLVPKLQATKAGEWLIYAEEADLLNVAVFGLTAKEWRDANPDLATNSNQRDHADILQLNILANLESLNSVMIESGTNKEKRFELLQKTAISQYLRLGGDEGRLEG